MHAVGSSGVTHVAGRGRRSSCRWVVADLQAGHYVRSEEEQEAVGSGKPRDIEAALLPRVPDVWASGRAVGVTCQDVFGVLARCACTVTNAARRARTAATP